MDSFYLFIFVIDFSVKISDVVLRAYGRYNIIVTFTIYNVTRSVIRDVHVLRRRELESNLLLYNAIIIL